jgi:secreted PhoX family phosphatase
MSSKIKVALTCDEMDDLERPAPETVEFEQVLDKAISRRDFLNGSAMLIGSGLFIQSNFSHAMSSLSEPSQTSVSSNVNTGSGFKSPFEFESVAASTADDVVLPEGFKWNPLVSWGDPLSSNMPEFQNAASMSAQIQSLCFGDNNDGMKHFKVDGHELLVINNEYVNFPSFFGHYKKLRPQNADDIQSTQQAVGVSIVEIKSDQNGWKIVQDSPFNRRITATSPMEITGPARGHAWVRTQADPKGEQSLGTWANCGSGKTPWGTYLTCEENFNGYYASEQEVDRSEAFKRYGISSKGYGYDWHLIDERFDIAKTPNEPNRSGYVVEINPEDPSSRPKKRTALGRFKHENAEMVLAEDGRIVVYMGDDERGEYLYRYVSNNAYHAEADIDDLMENGILYVAKFHEQGLGRWLPLTPETTGMSHAEICIHTRLAASKVGATTMDRPEWVAVNPMQADVFCALTNNKQRGVKTNKGGDAQPVGGPNPRAENHYGQVLRWQPEKSDHGLDRFKWNLFLLAGNPDIYEKGELRGSSNIHAGNMFNSPDGVHFDSQGKLWIQTDGKYNNEGDFEGMGNNQMLLASPKTGEIKRFMVGPVGCEVTGFAHSSDGKTLFVGIQHPDKSEGSRFPDGKLARSTVIAIWHRDGHVIA